MGAAPCAGGGARSGLNAPRRTCAPASEPVSALRICGEVALARASSARRAWPRPLRAKPRRATRRLAPLEARERATAPVAVAAQGGAGPRRGAGAARKAAAGCNEAGPSAPPMLAAGQCCAGGPTGESAAANGGAVSRLKDGVGSAAPPPAAGAPLAATGRRRGGPLRAGGGRVSGRMAAFVRTFALAPMRVRVVRRGRGRGLRVRVLARLCCGC